MEVVKRNPIPIYEVTCDECKSVIRYKMSEVSLLHITCPVCGMSMWANTSSPVGYINQPFCEEFTVERQEGSNER